MQYQCVAASEFQQAALQGGGCAAEGAQPKLQWRLQEDISASNVEYLLREGTSNASSKEWSQGLQTAKPYVRAYMQALGNLYPTSVPNMLDTEN